MEHKRKVYFMAKALELAELAFQAEEIPVGAVLVQGDTVIGTGYNSVIRGADPTAHAEVLAMRAGSGHMHNYRLPGTELFITLEPCLMCYATMVQARVKKLYFAAFDDKTGIYSTGAFDRLPAIFNHDIEVEAGIMQAESSRLLKKFFQERRGAGAVERDGLENR